LRLRNSIQLPITSTLFWALFCVSWAMNQPCCGLETTHTARLARRFSLSLAPISTASQNATKTIHFLGAFLRTMVPRARMLGHFTTTRTRKFLPSTVDPIAILHAPSPPRIISLQVAGLRRPCRFSCSGHWLMESLRISSPNFPQRGNVVSPLNHPTKHLLSGKSATFLKMARFS
jgi:hypothetical protein